jgi:predicted transcriptional regulator
MVKTLRLKPDLEDRLQRAAAVTGESLSEFIRRAAAERAEVTLRATSTVNFDDVLGAAHGGGGRARRTGAAFARALAERS